MPTMMVNLHTRDQWLVLKEELGYRSMAELLADAADYLEEHIEDFDVFAEYLEDNRE